MRRILALCACIILGFFAGFSVSVLGEQRARVVHPPEIFWTGPNFLDPRTFYLSQNNTWESTLHALNGDTAWEHAFNSGTDALRIDDLGAGNHVFVIATFPNLNMLPGAQSGLVPDPGNASPNAVLHADGTWY